MEKSQSASLQDVISYTPETYFKDDEIEIIRSIFNGPRGTKLTEIMRKAMLPVYTDSELPIEEYGKDPFLSMFNFSLMQQEETKSSVMGLQLAIKFVLGGLINLKHIANIKEETPANRAERRAKDSAQ